MKIRGTRSLAGALVAPALALCAAACTGEGPEAGGLVDAELVVAEDERGPITAGDIDDLIVTKKIPPPQDASRADWLEGLARRLAIDRLLYEEAILAGVDQAPDVLKQSRALLRGAHVRRHLGLQGLTPPTEDELRELYEERREELQRPEQRDVSHIFLRYGANGGREATVARLEALRERALAGEPFSALASEASESESRHAGGRLGLVERGRFSPDFDEVVFRLAPGEPSEVVTAKDGAHVFLVGTLIEEAHHSFEEAKMQLAFELSERRVLETIDDAVAALPVPTPDRVLAKERLQTALGTRQLRAMVLEIGDFTLSAGELLEEVRSLRQSRPGAPDPELPHKLLQQIRLQEIIYQHLVSEGLPELDEPQLDAELRRRVVEHYLQRRLEAYLDERPEAVKAHYDANTSRFADPPQVALTQLVVPAAEMNPRRGTRLEEARHEMDSGSLTLEDLAEELGVRLQQQPLVPVTVLLGRGQGYSRFVQAVEVGMHSPPFQIPQGMVIFRVDERTEPATKALSLVRPRVIKDYITSRGAELFAEFSAATLDAAGFRAFPDRLARAAGGI